MKLVGWVLFAISVGTVISSGCTEDGVPLQVCEGVECSQHGDCEVRDGQAMCVCEEGFVANGMECIEVNAEDVGVEDPADADGLENSEDASMADAGVDAGAVASNELMR